MLDKIYQALIADPFIAEQAAGRIKFYEYPATGDVSGAYIIIDPISPPIPDDYADDEWLTDTYLVQIDVWTKSRKLTEKLAGHVRKAMWSISFAQKGGIPEYDGGIFRDARHYRGKVYTNIRE